MNAAGLQLRAAGWQGWFSYCNKDSKYSDRQNNRCLCFRWRHWGHTLLYNMYEPSKETKEQTIFSKTCQVTLAAIFYWIFSFQNIISLPHHLPACFSFSRPPKCAVFIDSLPRNYFSYSHPVALNVGQKVCTSGRVGNSKEGTMSDTVIQGNAFKTAEQCTVEKVTKHISSLRYTNTFYIFTKMWLNGPLQGLPMPWADLALPTSQQIWWGLLD